MLTNFQLSHQINQVEHLFNVAVVTVSTGAVEISVERHEKLLNGCSI